MQEFHNPDLFGYVMKTPKDLKLTFRCPIVSSDQYLEQKQISKEEGGHQLKKCVLVPFTEEDLVLDSS